MGTLAHRLHYRTACIIQMATRGLKLTDGVLKGAYPKVIRRFKPLNKYFDLSEVCEGEKKRRK